MPGDLWVDARGQASSLEEAVTCFGKAAAELVSVIAFSANAAVGDLEPEVAFESTPSISKRIFVQSMLPNERAIVHARREVDVDMTRALVEAIENHSEKERIARAIGQYCLALRHWRWGHETLATSHLFMGIEALAKAVARYRQATSGLSDEDFARQLGIDLERFDSCRSLDFEIVSAVRREVLFRADRECYRNAKEASDGLEHGFLPYDKIREKAVIARDKTASYLRESIIELLDLNLGARSFYLDASNNRPLGNWPLVKYMRGYLIGESHDLAAKDSVYPILSWKSKVKSIDVSEEGDYKISFDEQFTPRLGPGITFQPERFEIWGP